MAAACVRTVFASVALAAATLANAAPNILVVMGDDHGRWAMPRYGLPELDTPNLDWLAERGVVFDQAFSPAPVCSPARASFHTGRTPSQHGVHDFLSSAEEFGSDWLDGETLLGERLQKLGYRTALIGKWHATTDSRKPVRGFDRWLSYDDYQEGWEAQYRHSGTVYFSDEGTTTTHTGVQARHLTEETIRFIDRPSDKPFFISLNFTEPHWPFEGLPERLVQRYRLIARDIIRAGDTSELPGQSDFFRVPPEHAESLAQYLAAVALIDEQIGRLVDALSGRGLLDSTLLVYTSDHGLLVGQYGLYGKVNATTPANFYEETIRIPLIVSGPPKLVRGLQARSEFVDLIDLHATVLDVAGADANTVAAGGPGRSLLPLLKGQRETAWRSLQFAERGRARMVTDGRWKLVRYHRQSGRPDDHWYDLAHPLGERFKAEPPRAGVQTRLTRALEEHFRRYRTKAHDGTRIWSQPSPNQRMRSEIYGDEP